MCFYNKSAFDNAKFWNIWIIFEVIWLDTLNAVSGNRKVNNYIL